MVKFAGRSAAAQRRSPATFTGFLPVFTGKRKRQSGIHPKKTVIRHH
ncbi:MAG TPA: hypothetical protein VFL47_11575 [Flavisolibacter sp.]|nr:hypothetical protein [Flavisolibacter sp.]